MASLLRLRASLPTLSCLIGLLSFTIWTPAQAQDGVGDLQLSTFESNLEGWVVNPDAVSGIGVSRSKIGATQGGASMEVEVIGNATGNQFTPSASVYWDDGSPQSDFLEAAIAHDPSKYVVEVDITFDPNQLHPEMNWSHISVVLNSDQEFGGAYSIQEKLARWIRDDGRVTRSIRWPLSYWQLASEGFYEMVFIYNGDVPTGGETKFYVDNIRISETGGLVEETLFSWEDGDTDGWAPTTNPDWTPVTSLTLSPANATDGNNSLRIQTPASGWTYGASISEYEDPLLDEALFLLVDLTLPASTPNFNQAIFVMYEPDIGSWQQQDVWFGGFAGEKTLTLPLNRTGTGPVDFLLGYNSPTNPATLFMVNIRVIRILPYQDPAPPLPFAVTQIGIDPILGEVNLTWNSKKNAAYSLWIAPDLQNWIELEDGIASDGEVTSFATGNVDLAAPVWYFQIREVVSE